MTPEQIFNEADAYLNDIFDFREQLLYFETFPYSRAILDVNRPTDSASHHRQGDGMIKHLTSYGDPVYYPGREPESDLKQYLIKRYWQPWHNRLAEIEQDERVKLVIDCHSMAAVGPSAYDDPFLLRPRVEVGNLGDEQGNLSPPRNRLSAPADVTSFFAEKLGHVLADVPDLTETGAATAINTPFRGGWNIITHGHKKQPWLLVELNRGLYIGHQNGNTSIVPLDPARNNLLRQRIWQAIIAVTEYIASKPKM